MGIGAVVLPVPPVEVVYHNRLVPVAINAVDVAFKQYITGVATTGARGNEFTVTFFGVETELPPLPSMIVNV